MADQGVPLSISKLNQLLEITDDESEAFSKRIRAMERQGQILRNRKDDFCISEKLNLIPGRVQGHPDGFGFLIPDQGGEECKVWVLFVRGLGVFLNQANDCVLENCAFFFVFHINYPPVNNIFLLLFL